MDLEMTILYDLIERKRHKWVLDKIMAIISIFNCGIIVHSFRSVYHNISRLFNGKAPRHQIFNTKYNNQKQTIMITLATARLINGRVAGKILLN